MFAHRVNNKYYIVFVNLNKTRLIKRSKIINSIVTHSVIAKHDMTCVIHLLI